jgi:hypothetical protein
MRAVLSERFGRAFIAAPPEAQKAFGKQLAHLLRHLWPRSLDAKKYPESGDPDFWHACVNDDWRFYFKIEADPCHLDSIRPHPK